MLKLRSTIFIPPRKALNTKDRGENADRNNSVIETIIFLTDFIITYPNIFLVTAVKLERSRVLYVFVLKVYF